jgi:hypothetical protein
LNQVKEVVMRLMTDAQSMMSNMPDMSQMGDAMMQYLPQAIEE